MSSATPSPTGWRLLPWQHLASVVLPAGIMLGALMNGGATSGSSGEAVADPVEVARARVGDARGLWVVQTREGYVLLWHGTQRIEALEWLPCDGPCLQTGRWDVAGLRRALRTVKRAHPEADTFTLVPGPRVSFRAVSDTLDAARYDGETPLFPYAVVSGR